MFHSLFTVRVLRDVDFWPVEQTDRSPIKEGRGRPEHQDAGADGRSDWTLGGGPGLIFFYYLSTNSSASDTASQCLLHESRLLLRQMFVSFKENALVTCSTDHLLILWKDGERQSHLRSLALFQKLEENGGL